MRLIILAFVWLPLLAVAQGVGINNPSPHASALLDLTSTAKGVLVPRMTTIQRNLIPAPASGLLVFDTTTNGFWYWNGTIWVGLATGTVGWSTTGNAGTVDGTHFLGTTDNVPLTLRVNNQQAGRVDQLLFNAFYGYQAGNATTTGGWNTAIGNDALRFNTQGSFNTATGNTALYSNTTGNANTAVGQGPLFSNTTGGGNTATGYHALYYNTSGALNTAMGNGALYFNTTGYRNTANGSEALYFNTTGAVNTAIGYQSLYSNTTGNNNTAIGCEALYSNTTGTNNTAIGMQSLRFNTTGTTNTAIGFGALRANTTGSVNTANGVFALLNNTTGTENTAIGYGALLSNITGFQNTANGYQALQGNTSGSGNTALGNVAGTVNTTGSNNTLIGHLSNVNAGNRTNATAIGANARVDVDNAVVLGSINGINGATATASVGIGTVAPGERLEVAGRALLHSGFSADNAALLYRTTTDYMFLGPRSGSAAGGGAIALYGTTNAVGANPGGIDLNTLGGSLRLLSNGNVGIGTAAPAERLHVAGKIRMVDGTQAAGRVLTSDANGTASWTTPAAAANAWSVNGNAVTVDGTHFIGTTDNVPLNLRVNNQPSGRVDHLLRNAFYGYQAGNANTTGNHNAAIGYRALASNTTGTRNTANGSSTLAANTTGTENTANGSHALTSNTTGQSNTASGFAALDANTTGSDNTATGRTALSTNTTGNYNVANGVQALHFNTTGSQNTANGFNALVSNNTGGSNTAMGYQALHANTTGTFNTGLGYEVNVDAGNRTNTVVIGGNSNLPLGGDNRVRIGNNAMTSIGGQVAWTAISDERTKNNVQDDVAGLDFIMRLRPVTYNFSIAQSNQVQGKMDTTEWAGKHDIERMRFSGFLAQQVQRAAEETGYDFSGVDRPADGDGLWGLRYAEFTVPLVKAVQEMNGTVQEQQALIAQLRAEMETMREELRQLRGQR